LDVASVAGATAAAAAILVIGYVGYKRMVKKTSSAESNKVTELKGVSNPAVENPTHIT
jgi:hypothetical protein